MQLWKLTHHRVALVPCAPRQWHMWHSSIQSVHVFTIRQPKYERIPDAVDGTTRWQCISFWFIVDTVDSSQMEPLWSSLPSPLYGGNGERGREIVCSWCFCETCRVYRKLFFVPSTSTLHQQTVSFAATMCTVQLIFNALVTGGWCTMNIPYAADAAACTYQLCGFGRPTGCGRMWCQSDRQQSHLRRHHKTVMRKLFAYVERETLRTISIAYPYNIY